MNLTQTCLYVPWNSLKRHICYIKNLRLEHDLPISVNNKVISAFREGFIFTKLSKTLPKISQFTECGTEFPTSALARIRKGQGAEALKRALCVALRKLGYTGGLEWKGMTTEGDGSGGGEGG